MKGLDEEDAPDSAAIYVDADFTDENSVKKAIAQGIKAFGGIDGLVNVPPPPPECSSKTNGVLHDLNLQSYQVRCVRIGRSIGSKVVRFSAEPFRTAVKAALISRLQKTIVVLCQD